MTTTRAKELYVDLLEAGYSRLGWVVGPVTRITVIEFGVNDGGGNGRGCRGIERSGGGVDEYDTEAREKD